MPVATEHENGALASWPPPPPPPPPPSVRASARSVRWTTFTLWQSMRPRPTPDREAGPLLKGFFRFHLRKTFISPFPSHTTAPRPEMRLPLPSPYTILFFLLSPPPFPINGNESRERGGEVLQITPFAKYCGRSVGRLVGPNWPQTRANGRGMEGRGNPPTLPTERERERKGFVCSETAERGEQRAFPHMDPHPAPPVVLWCHYSPPSLALFPAAYTASLGGGRGASLFFLISDAR